MRHESGYTLAPSVSESIPCVHARGYPEIRDLPPHAMNAVYKDHGIIL